MDLCLYILVGVFKLRADCHIDSVNCSCTFRREVGRRMKVDRGVAGELAVCWKLAVNVWRGVLSLLSVGRQ